MSDVILYLLIAVALAFAISSWWGVRRLKALHIRSTVGGDAQDPGLTEQRVAVILNPIKAQSDEAKRLIQRGCLAAGWEDPVFFETTAEDPGYSQVAAALAYKPDVVLVGGGRRP